MGKFIDLSGQKFGKLTVLYRSSEIGKPVKFMCVCDCGNKKEVRANDLKSGRTTSCGCIRREKAKQNKKNLIGKRFGRLTVIEATNDRQNRAVVWKCKCDCGNEILVPTGKLTSGNTQSCGCLRLENLSKKISYDLIGKKFGKLTVINKTGLRKDRNIIWECKCDCGNTHYVTSTLLINGKVKSCGCLKSQGEEIISYLLEENNIIFEIQKSFDTCIFPTTKAKAKFDFYIDNKYLIEFDGKQHFNEGGWGQPFELIQYRDLFKNDWCKKNNIPLIRIPYTHLKKITIEDLKLESSPFLMKG